MASGGGGSAAKRMSGSEYTTTADVIIIGAGIAGLAAAESLRRAGCSSMIVLEARNRIGGRIYTDDLLGFPIDLGASWIRGVDGNPLSDVPIRLEGLSNVMIFDQRNRSLPEDTSRSLIDCVWAARERLISAAGSSPEETDAQGDSSMMPPSSLLSPTSKSKKPGKLRRRQSWWERRRLSVLDEPLTTEGGDRMENLQGPGAATSTIAVDPSHPVTKLSYTDEPGSSLEEGLLPRSPAGGMVGKDISVRDWIMDEEEFCDDLNKTDVSRRMLLDLVNVIENLEAVDLDSIGLLHYDRRGFSGPHLYVADGMAELVGATASGILGEGKNILRVNHIVSKIDYSTDPSTDQFPVRIYTNRGLYRCRSAIVTIPLGVLKHHHTTLLHPPLSLTSPNHKSSIERLGFGLIDKIILEFSSPFWPDRLDGFWAFLPPLKRGMDFDEGEDAPALVGFVNMERMHAAVEEGGGDGSMEVKVPGPPVLVAYVSQRSALRIEQMEDGEVGELFVGILKKCFGTVAELISVRVTRWDIDPFSRGACTFIPVGVSTPTDITDLSLPLPFPSARSETPNKAIYFAGEHCSRHHFGTVHGALMSGWSTAVTAAHQILVTAEMDTVALPPKNVRATYRRTNPKGGLTLVLKLGTSSICDEKTYFPKLSNLSMMVETVVKLRSLGHAVVIVSSGAVGVGLKRLNLDRRPKHLPQVQAVAAVGQGRLMALYDDLFGRFDVPIAQILLTRDTIAERSQYLNACNTFKELLAMGVVPIVNENDTVSHAEIRFGDNDTLSAITAGMISADYLFLCTDVECLYTDNPRMNPDAKPVRVVDDISRLREQVTVSSPGSSLGTGGMVTKLIAADLATAAGCSTIITLGSKPNLILSILEEIAAYAAKTSHPESSPIPQPSKLQTESSPPFTTSVLSSALLEAPFEPTIGTHFLAKPNPMLDRKWWVLHGLSVQGVIRIDAGAVRATVKNRSSLFAAGVVGVEGTFSAQQSVKVVASAVDVAKAGFPEVTVGEGEVEIGRGVVNYNSVEISRILGCKSREIVERLGYMDSEFLVHRDNFVVTLMPNGAGSPKAGEGVNATTVAAE
ncbi:hypothetical protein HDU67_002437 [Dinochytrium kinnereticum]|nr:hypothetical protein HDU67_002437 [Dinochytrium kinnereticum]